MVRMNLAVIPAFALLVAAPAGALESRIDSRHYQLQVETVIEGLEHPWGMAFLPDGRFLVTERNSGRIRLGSADGELSGPVAQVNDLFRYEGETSRSQAGLFDIVLHPRFEDNGYVYFSYSKETERGAAVAVDRARFVEEGGSASLEDRETIFEMKEEDQDSSGLHFGGRMAFDEEDDVLFLSIGERRNISRAQDRDDQAGSVLRMTAEGGVPEDNPFAGDDSGDDYIYTIGHRNVQALAIDPRTGELWAADHGPKGGDEVNRIVAGANYGWPYITGGEDYSGAPLGIDDTEMVGMTPAVHIFEETIAPSGMAFVEEDAFSEWAGDILIGGLAAVGIVRLRMQDGAVAEEEVIEIGRRIRDVHVGDDGAIWVLTEHADGEVLRLTTRGQAPAAARAGAPG